MGWTSYNANYYNSKGEIDRKAECDAYWLDSINKGYYVVLKSVMVGSTYYAAIKALKQYSDEKDENGHRLIVDIPENEQNVFAVVMLTSVDNHNYYNFSYKVMDETFGPCAYTCPDSILKLLTPTDSKYAIEWRKKCSEHNRRKKELAKLPIGTIIRFSFNGKVYEAIKQSPSYQFKTEWWQVVGDNLYFKKKNIPFDYEVIK